MPTITTIRDRLKRFQLDRPTPLHLATGLSRQTCHTILHRGRFGVHAAKAIGKALSLPWEVIYGWRDDGR
jgi:hypothetical protein